MTFFIFHMAGGDPALMMAGKNATPEQIQSLRQELGTDQPWFQQYLFFLKQTLTFNWGYSWSTQENINSMFLNRVGASLSLTLPAYLISLLISIGLSLWVIGIKRKWLDRSVTRFCLGMLSISFLVYIICFQYFFAYYLDLFELNGWSESWVERWRYLFLPWIILVIVLIGPNLLIFRSAFTNETLQNYVRTAQAKGLGGLRIYASHILTNALLPIVTIVMSQIPFLMTGNLLLEKFFGVPGLGELLVQAIQNADFPVIKAFTVVGSLLYILFNLLGDFLYAWLDPRVELK